MVQADNRTSFDHLELISSDTLFLFALDAEAAEEFHDVNKLIVGAGKVNAAYELTKAVYHRKPKLIINLGSAGSSTFKRGEVVCCTQFIQRDMDARALGFKKYETPFSDMPPVLNYGIKMKGLPEAICG